MSKSTSIGHLPNEILKIIFEYVGTTADWKEARMALYQCQLVCKIWSRLTKTGLYKDVCLTPDEIGGFGITLTNAPGLGLIVKSVKVCRDNANSKTPFPQEANQGIDSILKHSPNLEVFGSSLASFEILMIWIRILNAADNQLRNPRLFSLAEEWPSGGLKAYSLLSLKFKDSLSILRLSPSALSGYRIHHDTNFCTLKSHVKDFKSLEQLQLCGNFVTNDSIITELDSLIDICLDTVHSLDLQKCSFLSNHDYRGQMKSRSSIRKLQLRDPLLSSAAIQYFATKLTALTTFVQ